jgi:FMN phosphatase YigB (HAD superfamily)
VRAVLFDFAGTLLCPRPAAEWVALAARRIGMPSDPDRVERLAARYLEAGLPGAPYPATVPDDLAALYAERDLQPESHRAAYIGLLATVPAPEPGLAEAIYEQIHRPEGWIPYEDARDVVDTLVARGLRVGLVSNVGFDVRPILRHHGFATLAERCTLSYEVGAMKPSPEIFRAALRSVGASAPETLMVGDHAEADGGAAALGLRTLILPMSSPEARHGLERVLEIV